MDDKPRVRSFKERNADYFHHPIEVKPGWYPYEEELYKPESINVQYKKVILFKRVL